MMDKSRFKDLATLLPWLGAFLFTPPILLLFKPSVTIFGIPLLPVYLFVTWFVLILASRQLTKHLVDEPHHPSQTTPTNDRP